MPSHAPLVTSATTSPATKLEQQPPLRDHADDLDVRASTAMAIVELLATGSPVAGSLNPTTTPTASRTASQTAVAVQPQEATPTPPTPLTPSLSPLWVDSRLHRKNSTSSSASSSSNSGDGATPIAQFPSLPSLLPMKRPLWRTSSTSPGDPLKPMPVPIQPLPSIAQLSKLAISATERLSPTAIDGVASAGISAMHATRSSPVLAPTLAPASATATASASASASASVVPAPAVPTSVNHSRKRQKDELDRLRVQVQELQRELDHVRSRLPKRPAPELSVRDGAPGSSELLASLLPSSVAVWERIATHQKEQKNRSEMENMKLKAMVTEQVKISKALEKLVNKRCKNSTLESKLTAKRLRVCETEEQQIFDALAHDIDTRYRHSGAVFEQLGSHGGSGIGDPRPDAQMILDPVHGPTMELRDATVFPFDVEAIAAAVWRSMEAEALGCAESMGVVASLLVHCSEDTVCTRTSVPIRQPRTAESELCVRAVVRRFVERQRVVILWESISDCLGKLPVSCAAFSSGASPLPRDVEMRDRGWCVIEALPSAPGRHSSVIQLCSHITPRAIGGTGSGASASGVGVGATASGTESSAPLTLQHMQGLVDALAPCYRYVWETRQQIMENILMENVVGMPRGVASAWGPVAEAPVHATAL